MLRSGVVQLLLHRRCGDFDGKRLTLSMMLGDILHFWRYIGAVDANIVHNNSGPLGAQYDKGGEGIHHHSLI